MAELRLRRLPAHADAAGGRATTSLASTPTASSTPGTFRAAARPAADARARPCWTSPADGTPVAGHGADRDVGGDGAARDRRRGARRRARRRPCSPATSAPRYDAARRARRRRTGRGLRLTLSLAARPRCSASRGSCCTAGRRSSPTSARRRSCATSTTARCPTPPTIDAHGAHPRRRRQPARPRAARRRRRAGAVEQAVAAIVAARARRARLARAGHARAGCARRCATAATTCCTTSATATSPPSGDGVLYLEDDDGRPRASVDATLSPTCSPTRPRCGSSCSTRARAPGRR